MKSAQGFSHILIIIVVGIVLVVATLNFASNNLRGKSFSFSFGNSPKYKEQAPSEKPKAENQANSGEGLNIKVTDQFFSITGNNVAELLDFLINKGPTLETGHKGVANCQMGYNWIPHVSSNKKLELCRMDSVELEGKIICTYPKWDPPAGASEQDINKWNTFMEKVRFHEQGHIDIAKKSLNSFYAQLQEISTKPTCDEIREEVVRIGHEMIEKATKEDLDYDFQTQHGETQGAVLIP